MLKFLCQFIDAFSCQLMPCELDCGLPMLCLNSGATGLSNCVVGLSRKFVERLRFSLVGADNDGYLVHH